MKVEHRHRPRGGNGGQCERSGHRRDRRDSVGEFGPDSVGHHPAVTHAGGVDSGGIQGHPSSDRIDQQPRKLHVIDVIVPRFAAAIASVPREQAFTRAGACWKGHHGPPVGSVAIEPGEPPHHLRMALAAVEGDHQWPAGLGRLACRQADDGRTHPRPHWYIDCDCRGARCFQASQTRLLERRRGPLRVVRRRTISIPAATMPKPATDGSGTATFVPT